MAIAPIAGVTGIGGAAGTQATGGATAAPKADFASGLKAVDQAMQQADALGTQVATGQLKDIHQFTAAAAKANLAMELTVAVRNKAVEAYQEIMRMQV